MPNSFPQISLCQCAPSSHPQNRCPVVATHAHRQGIQFNAVAAQRSAIFLSCANGSRCAAKSCRAVGRHISPRNEKFGILARRLRGRGGPWAIRRTSRFVVDIDLQADIERSEAGRALIAESLRRLQRVNGVNPVKVLSDDSCFIVLQVPDKVPGQVQVRVWAIFSRPSWTKFSPKSRCPASGAPESSQGLFFAYGEQLHGIGLASGLNSR